MALQPPHGGNSSSYNPWRQAGLALTIPTMMAAGPFVGYFLGYLLDRWLGFPVPWDRWVKIIGALVGLIAGMRETIKLIKKIAAETES